jgi:tetratricopeptide (TPR) repeat protein
MSDEVPPPAAASLPPDGDPPRPETPAPAEQASAPGLEAAPDEPGLAKCPLAVQPMSVGLAVLRILEMGLFDGGFLLILFAVTPWHLWNQDSGFRPAALALTSFLAALMVVHVRGRPLDRRSLALRLPRPAQLLLVLLLVAPLALVGTESSNTVARGLGWERQPPQPESAVLATRPQWCEQLDNFYLRLARLPLGLVLVFGCVLPGLGEELFFRGFLGRGLVARHGPFLGVALTSVLFGLVHLDPLRIAATTVLGVGLHFVYLTTRSFWAPVLLHTLNNALAFGSHRLALAAHLDLSGQYEAAHLSPVLTLAAVAAVAALGWALYRTRTRWALPDGTAWGPGYVSAEAPPVSLTAVPSSHRLALAPGLAVAGVYLTFVAAAVFTFLADLDGRRADQFVFQANNDLDQGAIDRAIEGYDEAIRLAPGNALAHCNRGLAYFHKNDLERALADLDRAVELDPNLADAHGIRGQVHHTRGNLDDALRDCDKAIALRPDDPAFLHNRGKVYLALGDPQKAVDDLFLVLTHKPSLSEARSDRGEAYRQMGEYAKAEADWTEVLRQQPEDARTCALLAWLRAACPDEKHRNGVLAQELAQRACKLTSGKDSHALGSLAAAHAARGQFDDAVRWQQKALDLAPLEQKVTYLQLLELYRARKPYRFSGR